ncbi:MAG: N-formylglutamate deformylase [Xanthomonadales bacterium]|jgi:N-formylglutamate deformylase|nr:N-formylglutamate deformylase [Xanthomonadales bacterium]MCC6559781.1 N-formylglutamate deformylase [Xanthomonadales bacterium]
MDIVSLHRGTSPLILSCPHDGSFIPEPIRARLQPRAQLAPDTDWHISRLYGFARAELGASMLVPAHSRYVVDLNRPPDGIALYPGRRETGLVPTTRFDGEPVYLDGGEPEADEIRARVDTYWRPYHEALAAEIARVHAVHGRVLLWEAHSIRSQVPMFFDGRLPDLNLGTADGASAGAALTTRMRNLLEGQSAFSHVINGRFKGGYITRHYAEPARGIEAVQLEMAQCSYMDEDSFAYRDELAAMVQPVLRALLTAGLG